MSFPTQLSDVTVDWLNEVFIKKGVLTTERIISFDAEPVARQGFTSMTHIITLSYDRTPEQAPNKIIGKFSLDNEAVKEHIRSIRGFQREVNFYTEFGEDAGIPIPRCYAAEYDPDNESCMLLLDYIDNTCQRDMFSGTVADIESAVEHLAAFHAKWWGKTHELKGIYHRRGSFLLELNIKKLTVSLDNIYKKYRDKVGQTAISLLELWLPNAHLLDNYILKGPLTLCHGDFHRDQLLFPISEGDPFCAIDWQFVSIDCGPADLARLIIIGGLFPDQRREKECELVEKYHALLLRHGVKDYSIEQTWEHYRLGIVEQALFYLCTFEEKWAISDVINFWAADERLKRLSFWDVICNWPSQALEEHGVLDLLADIVRTN